MNRRRFLGWVGAGGVTALAGCPATNDDPNETPRDAGPGGDTGPENDYSGPTADPPMARANFENTVNALDLGADAEGEESIDGLLREQARADGSSLVVFPEGRYRVGNVELEDAAQFGMAAAEGATPKLVPSGPASDIGTTLLQFLSVDGFLFEGFELDFRESGFGGKLHVTTTGDLTVRNVRVQGQYPPKASGFHLAVESEDASGLVENVSAPGGGPQGGKSIGMFVDRRHAGDLTVRNCFLQHFPNNGLYASAPGGDGDLRGYGGRVRVLGGLYRNNNIANVRLGGKGAVARGVTVVVDEVPPYNNLNARGVLFRNGTDHRVENCRVVLGENAGYSLGAVVFNPDAGRVYVRDTHVETDRDRLPAVYAPSPSKSVSGPSGPVFENVSIVGSAGGSRTVEVVGRDDTEFRNCRVVQSGPNRDGIRFDRSRDCLLARSTIDVTGVPVQNDQSSVSRQNVNIRQ